MNICFMVINYFYEGFCKGVGRLFVTCSETKLGAGSDATVYKHIGISQPRWKLQHFLKAYLSLPSSAPIVNCQQH